MIRLRESLLCWLSLPWWGVLVTGVILLIAVSLASLRLLKIRNRLELFG